MQVSNLLFDLGGVLFSLDIQRMFDAFDNIKKPGSPGVAYTKNQQHEVFYKLDRGHIDENEFAQGLIEAYGLAGTKEQVLDAWNALLIGVIPGRAEALQELSTRFELALLSNTNEFHRRYFEPQCREIFAPMKRLFYSYEMGLRKPDAAIYEKVLEEMNWKAEETLFIDDTEVNVSAAREVGMQAFWMEQETDFEKLISELIFQS